MVGAVSEAVVEIATSQGASQQDRNTPDAVKLAHELFSLLRVGVAIETGVRTEL